MPHEYELDVVHADAFTDVPYGGNPATVILGADKLSRDTMHKISTEFNVRETVFVSDSDVADYRFRYMTPDREINFSGHATVAAFHALLSEGVAETTNQITMFTLETNTGVFEVEAVRDERSQVYEIQITHQPPQFLTTYDPKDYANALGLTLADIMAPKPVQTVSTGTPHLMIPVSTYRSLERIRPDWNALEEMRRDSDYVSIQVFSRDTREETSDAHARHFAPGLGVPEDPVSGSAAGGMASYMVRYGMMDSSNPVTSIVIEQGDFLGRPGKIYVEIRGNEDKIEQVKVSGKAVTVLRGKLYI
ncbi:MAG: PhzF family phenazine biosynthesis isomerase [Candidatus Lokiarchaeota archaeon]|nr:PhzF family phenazine biosynthesis isomerase [Candidatus Lokiarchaeota archaeon]